MTAKKNKISLYPKEVELKDLKKGDRITRTKPTHLEDDEMSDDSFIGIPLIFLGIANGCIYLERDTQAEKLIYGTYITLPLFYWEHNWTIYEQPDFLENINVLAVIEQELNAQYEKTLIIELEKAEQEDDYEKAKLIQSKIDEIVKKRQEYQKKNPLPPYPSLNMIYNNHIENEDD